MTYYALSPSRFFQLPQSSSVPPAVAVPRKKSTAKTVVPVVFLICLPHKMKLTPTGAVFQGFIPRTSGVSPADTAAVPPCGAGVKKLLLAAQGKPSIAAEPCRDGGTLSTRIRNTAVCFGNVQIHFSARGGIAKCTLQGALYTVAVQVADLHAIDSWLGAGQRLELEHDTCPLRCPAVWSVVPASGWDQLHAGCSATAVGV